MEKCIRNQKRFIRKGIKCITCKKYEVCLFSNFKIENFATEAEAENFAKENCAFEYTIVEL